MDGNNQGQLLWVSPDTDGEQGTIARTGDSGGAAEPTFSHDGTQIVYVSGRQGSFADGRFSYGPGDLYVVPYSNRAGSNPQAEVFVVPSGGGTATRVGANDPPACQSGAHGPGIGNDWAKWSPRAMSAANGKTYCWLVFSSKRSGHAQLYLAPMTVAGGAADASYPALYLWNQPATDDNHTPSWDDYQIPPVIVP